MDQAPKTLDIFFNHLKIQDASVLDKMDQIITDNIWHRKFHQYLKSRDLEDEINIHKFLIAMKSLENIEHSMKVAKQKASQKLKEQHNILLKRILGQFFSEEDIMLPLSNSKLRYSFSFYIGVKPSLNHPKI